MGRPCPKTDCLENAYPQASSCYPSAHPWAHNAREFHTTVSPPAYLRIPHARNAGMFHVNGGGEFDKLRKVKAMRYAAELVPLVVAP